DVRRGAAIRRQQRRPLDGARLLRVLVVADDVEGHGCNHHPIRAAHYSNHDLLAGAWSDARPTRISGRVLQPPDATVYPGARVRCCTRLERWRKSELRVLGITLLVHPATGCRPRRKSHSQARARADAPYAHRRLRGLLWYRRALSKVLPDQCGP